MSNIKLGRATRSSATEPVNLAQSVGPLSANGVRRAVSLRLEPAAARAAQDDDDDDDDDNDRDDADADDDDGDHVTRMFHDATRTDSIVLISSRRQQEKYKRGRK